MFKYQKFQQIVRLENRLLRVNVMQMEADIVCQKYKNVHANLKKDAEVFASWLEKLADDIKEQNIEIQRLRVTNFFFSFNLY